MAIEKWGSAITVSQTNVGDSDEGVVAALPNGGFVTVWNYVYNGSTVTCFRIVDGLGRPGAIQTVASTAGIPRYADVAVLADGSFVIAWSGASTAIQAQKFSITGVPETTQPLTLADPVAGRTNDLPAVAASGQNGWAAVWVDTHNTQADNIWFQRAGGQKVSITTVLDPNGTAQNGVNKPDVTMVKNGKHVVTWEKSGVIQVALVELVNGQERVTALADAFSSSSMTASESSVTALSTGGFAVSWVTYEGSKRYVSTQVYNVEGNKIGSVTKAGNYIDYPPQVVGPTKGGFAGGYALVYVDNLKINDNADIYLQLVKSDGTTVVGPTLINTGTLQKGSQRLASVAELPDGRISVVWDTSNESPARIYTQIIDAREEAVIVQGTSHNDIYVGTTSRDGKFSDVDELYGYGGNDTLYGGGGGDFLTGGIGGDSLVCGAGNDWAIYMGAEADPNQNWLGVVANLADATQNRGEAAGDRYDSIENLQGSNHRDSLTGNAVNNWIAGETGDDTLNGGAGDDTLDGGEGSDRFYGGAGADSIDGGIDSVAPEDWDDVSYQTATAAIRLVLADASGRSNLGDAYGDQFSRIDAYVGSRYDDVMIGKAGWDTFYGDAGNDLLQGGTEDNSTDYLNGQAGNDTLEGGLGADSLIGGEGNDFVSYVRSSAGVVINLLAGEAHGGDAIGDKITEVEGIIGSSHHDHLTGGNTSNTLEGGVGNDTLNGGGGFDYASYAGSGVAVAVNLGTNAKSGGAAGDVYDSIEGLIGSAHADTLTGDANDNVLRGGGGNDTLTGGAGADVLDGGVGIDTVSYAGASAGVTVNLANGTGAGSDAQGDTYAEIENVIGSNFADVFIGNAAVNVFQGGEGDDIYYVGAGDIVIENGYSGNDKVITDGNYTLGNNIQALQGIGNGALVLTGNALNNTIVGNAAGNWIDGGAGADTMMGGGGDDIYLIDNVGDVVTDFEGNNSVVSTVQLNLNNLQGNFTNITVAEGFNFNVEGTSGHNVLKGNAFANTLKGNGGNDKLYGMLGNDKLYGGAGRDTFVFDTRLNKTKNVDKIYDFKSRDDSFHLDNAIFTKLGRAGSEARPKKFNSDMFVEGSRAKDREDRIVYDKKTGALYYDQDGTGSKAQVKIATLTNKTKLYYHDFFVI
jgi:Ca2+-binding RTX toxin-like protein